MSGSRKGACVCNKNQMIPLSTNVENHCLKDVSLESELSHCLIMLQKKTEANTFATNFLLGKYFLGQEIHASCGLNMVKKN
jgi:hypothetical protein